jgi:hypothetical protein
MFCMKESVPGSEDGLHRGDGNVPGYTREVLRCNVGDGGEGSIREVQ